MTDENMTDDTTEEEPTEEPTDELSDGDALAALKEMFADDIAKHLAAKAAEEAEAEADNGE